MSSGERDVILVKGMVNLREKVVSFLGKECEFEGKDVSLRERDARYGKGMQFFGKRDDEFG